MAFLTLSASTVAFSTPLNPNFASGDLVISKATPVLPLRIRRRRFGVVRASSTGDENLIPESAPGAGAYDNYVDANMMVLRRRIEGMRVKETFIQSPDEWMEWEKSCYRTYRADINVWVAALQNQLLGMRPSLVLAIVSCLLAVTPVASLLFLSAIGSQLSSVNNAVLDLLAPCSVNPPL